MPMSNKLRRVMRYNVELSPIKPDGLSVCVLVGHMKHHIYFISTRSRLMDTKHSKVVTYREEHLPIKSHDYLNNWSCKVTRQTKYISPLVENQ